MRMESGEAVNGGVENAPHRALERRGKKEQQIRFDQQKRRKAPGPVEVHAIVGRKEHAKRQMCQAEKVAAEQDEAERGKYAGGPLRVV